MTDIDGVVHSGREDLDGNRIALAEQTNPRGVTGTLRDALVGADVFIGVSAPAILTGDDVATMAERAVVFALANPDPDGGSGRGSPYCCHRRDRPQRRAEPDQQRAGLFGVFRGLLDAGATVIDLEMEAAAAEALAEVVSPGQLNAAFIVPSVFDPAVTQAVAEAVRKSVQARRQ